MLIYLGNSRQFPPKIFASNFPCQKTLLPHQGKSWLYFGCVAGFCALSFIQRHHGDSIILLGVKEAHRDLSGRL